MLPRSRRQMRIQKASTALINSAAADGKAARADANATTALNQVSGLSGRMGGLENHMGTVETGVAGAMAMGAASSNAANAASRSAKGMGLGIGASVFSGSQATTISYAGNFVFGSVSAAASLTASPSIQVGAGFAF